MMKNAATIIVVGLIALFCFSCKEKSTNPILEPTISFAFQSSKCLAHELARTSALDSSFTYVFHDSLLIDFTVSANCCPDSNRFHVAQSVGSDTILIAVADTAINGCRCNCPYMIHAAFTGLTNDHYVVRCTLRRSAGIEELIYLVEVYRK
jgi:hypothetical protein